MSLHAYRESQEIEGERRPFYALIMAAMRQADDKNTAKLRACWPEVYAELKARYWAPGGLLPGEAAPVETQGSHCAECGPNVRVDEDGCCSSCGSDALWYSGQECRCADRDDGKLCPGCLHDAETKATTDDESDLRAAALDHKGRP